MTAVRFLTRNELEQRLAAYRCQYVRTFPDGTELWQTGWNEPFVLTPESGDNRYDEWQYFQLLAHVIAKTMPPDWNNESKPH